MYNMFTLGFLGMSIATWEYLGHQSDGLAIHEVMFALN